MSTKKLTLAAMLIAVTAVMAYLDTLIPMPLPGIKLGLANVGILLTYHILGKSYAGLVSLLRVLLVALITGFAALPYSLAGAVCSYLVILIFGKRQDIALVSIVAAVAHCVAQIAVAAVILAEPMLFLTYLPLIGVAAILCGFLTGTAAKLALKNLNPQEGPRT